MSEITNEVKAGITEYVCPGPGFSGIIKSRYSDFQVHEINLNNEIALLTDRRVPNAPKLDDSNSSNSSKTSKPSRFDTQILPLETWEKLNSLTGTEKFQIDATSMTKEERTSVHNSVKKAFGKKIVGSTVNSEQNKFLVFSNFVKGTKIDTREKWEWPGDFVHFVVYKENCDTMEAASQIAERLKMKCFKTTYFGYCGTKDKRGKTSQWFSVKRVDPKKIVNNCKVLRNIKVGNFTFKDYNLKLGQLKGNMFEIALRNVTADKSLVEQSLTNLREKGFINYYGLQRFGNKANVPTFAIGRQILCENFEEAVNLILEPQGIDYKILKKYQDTKDAELALSNSPRFRNSIEMKLLQALKNGPKNNTKTKYVEALNKIPRNTRLLYIHSYQSWVWNQCVSERLKKFGFNCCPGDLVLLDSAIMPENIEEIPEATDENFELGSNDENLNTNINDESKKEQNVKVLSLDDVASGQYTIYDVVMPLPGFTMEYPPNMKDFYEEILNKDNLNLDLKQKLRSYSLSGVYRHMVSRLEDMSWKYVRYDDPHCDLILSDMDILNNKAPVKDLPDGKYNALVLKFNLPSSTYATMALRELLKTDTSKEFHTQINSYAEEKISPGKRKISITEDSDAKMLKVE